MTIQQELNDIWARLTTPIRKTKAGKPVYLMAEEWSWTDTPSGGQTIRRRGPAGDFMWAREKPENEWVPVPGMGEPKTKPKPKKKPKAKPKTKPAKV